MHILNKDINGGMYRDYLDSQLSEESSKGVEVI